MDLYSLLNLSSLDLDDVPRNHPRAWMGHRYFAKWLIAELNPDVFVELGTHYGLSYFSFCSAIKEFGLSTKCYAVDTWQGDEHAGNYSENVFNYVNNINEKEYESFSTLIRSTFDDALKSFQDGTIDLLHIDGLHSYEAVKHDFETWLPKMKAGGVILFHDTEVKESDFGVFELWDELKKKYPANIEFRHSAGLGVIQLPNQNNKNLQLLYLKDEEKDIVRKYFEFLGLNAINTQITKESLNDRELELASSKEIITDLEGAKLNAESQIKLLKGSWSWRLTLPLRKLKGMFNFFKRKNDQ